MDALLNPEHIPTVRLSVSIASLRVQAEQKIVYHRRRFIECMETGKYDGRGMAHRDIMLMYEQVSHHLERTLALLTSPIS